MKRDVKGRIIRGSAITATFLAAVLLYDINAFASESHGFSTKDCQLCHVQDGGLLPAENPRSVEDIHTACDQCHSSCEPWGIHDGRRQDAGRMAVALPVSKDGAVGCVTCHDPHPGDESPDRAYGTPNLRIGNLKRELCLNCHHDSPERQWLIDVAAPPSGAVVRERHVPLLGRAEALPGRYLQVSVNGGSFPLRVDEGTFHTRLTLQEGPNVVEISVNNVSLWRGELFLAAGEVEENRYDRTFYGHQTSTLAECLSCHGSDDGSVFSTAVKTGSGLCYQCHDAFDEKRYLHGPLAVGECDVCHDPHGGIGPKHLHAEEVELCRSCHGDDEVLGHRGGRDALAGGNCSSCHDPHQSDGRFLIKQALL